MVDMRFLTFKETSEFLRVQRINAKQAYQTKWNSLSQVDGEGYLLRMR
jgi:hypothetical protein